MKVPGIGEVTKDDEFGWYYSKPIPVPMFGGKECRIVLEGYDEDEHNGAFRDVRSYHCGIEPSRCHRVGPAAESGTVYVVAHLRARVSRA